jgi:hypothetical protein
MQFSVRKTWSGVAMRMVKAVFDETGAQSGVLDVALPEFALRGEGRYFWRSNDQKDDDYWWDYGATMKVVSADGGPAPPNCKSVKKNLVDYDCEPADQCKWESAVSWNCIPNRQISSNGWFHIRDQTLSGSTTPSVGDAKSTAADLKAITAAYYCGPKKLFNSETAGPSVSNFRECLVEGVQTNARLHSLYPWKLYIEDEVMVVVRFSGVAGRQCEHVGEANTKSTVCGSDAVETPGFQAHLTNDEKTSQDGVYQGLHSGAGFPKGTPEEVFLRPEDILEAAGFSARR